MSDERVPPDHRVVVLGFVTTVIERGDKSGKDYAAILISEEGEVAGSHIGESVESCRGAFLGVWQEDLERMFPHGFRYEWVDHPDREPRVAEANRQAELRDPLRAEGPGEEFPDGEGNRDGVQHLFDVRSGVEVVPGMYCWIPKDRADGTHKHPISFLPRLVRLIHFGRGVIRDGDPMIVGPD